MGTGHLMNHNNKSDLSQKNGTAKTNLLKKKKTSNSQLGVLGFERVRPTKKSVLDAMITRKEVKNVDVQSS